MYDIAQNGRFNTILLTLPIISLISADHPFSAKESKAMRSILVPVLWITLQDKQMLLLLHSTHTCIATEDIQC